MQYRVLATKLSVTVTLSRPFACAVTGTWPVSLEEIMTVCSVSFPLGIVILEFFSFPFVDVIFICVSFVAVIGFPFLSSSCRVMIDFVAPSATMFVGFAVILSCVGPEGFFGLFSNL